MRDIVEKTKAIITVKGKFDLLVFVFPINLSFISNENQITKSIFSDFLCA